ncbi:MAG: DNA polymerase III subunit gamma/tau [Gammaproteobacteria bacterium]|nr:DNA polymerase III subunit gamma/tau [Gammaproteobacteria bacterium]
MTYQVLARKWRPRAFDELVGQGHVVRALTNALDSGRLHHAYLFTGTRGVGKTTIARILAKCLNCLEGVSSHPCGECQACRSIDEGRFVDLIEVDAASRTKVDETRELLDNVPYAPASGRYKVYLIDEVHMFSNHSFNALLKTLEEPPPHAKFLLATTDPQKVPVTILSRCLQFNLKGLAAAEIAEQVTRIVRAEGIEAEPGAAQLLAVAADGSVRDALSLLDQAIAFGHGRLVEADVREMLGTLDRGRVLDVLEALAAADGAGVLRQVAEMTAMGQDLDGALAELATVLQRIAVIQVVGAEAVAEDLEQERMTALAGTMSPEDIQLWYQVAVHGRRDLPYAPDHRAGMEMTLLRMLAFRPAEAVALPAAAPPTPPREPADRGRQPQARATPSPEPAPSGALGPAAVADTAGHQLAAATWADTVAALDIKGLAREMLYNMQFKGLEGDTVHVLLDHGHRHLHGKERESQVAAALGAWIGRPLRLAVEFGTLDGETPASVRSRRAGERQRSAEQTIERDPNIRHMQEALGAVVVNDSIKPAD